MSILEDNESAEIIDELREEIADLRTRLAASEAGWARVERAIEEAGEELAPRDYAECIGAIAARARKAEAALASEWERAYRAGLEAAAKAIEA